MEGEAPGRKGHKESFKFRAGMPPARKLGFALALAMLVAMALGIASVLQLRSSEWQQLVLHQKSGLVKAQDLQMLRERQARYLREYLLTGSPESLRLRQEAHTQLEAQLQELDAPGAPAERRRLLIRVREASERVEDNMAELRAEFQRHGRTAELLARFEREARSAHLELDEAVTELVLHEEQTLEAAVRQVAHGTRRALFWLGGATLLAVLMSLALSALLLRALRALTASESRYRATFDQAAVGMAQVALDGHLLRLNPRYCDLIGYTPEEARHLRFQDITYQEDLNANLVLYQQLLSGELRTYSMEKRYVRKDGALVWVNLTASLVRDREQRPAYFIAVAEDITDRKQAEAALRESERRLSTLVANLPGMAYRSQNTPSWPLEYASQGALALTGHPPEAFERGEVTFSELIHPEDRGMVWDTVQQALAERRAFQLIYRLRTARGELKWAWEQGMGVYGPEGQLLALEGLITDITERKLAEQERELLLEELRQAVRLRDDFLSVASHELKTPLTSLRLQLDVLRNTLRRRQGGVEAEPLLRRTEAALRQTERLGLLVGNLLDVSRISSGHLELNREEVDLVELVRDVLERLAPDAQRAQSHLRFQGPEALVGSWDKLRLEQVVTNLVSNALKYGAGHPVEVRVEAARGQARLVVRDSGIGFEPGQQERIFGRFERAVSSRHYGGLGLGLYISRQIVDALGGSIHAEGQPGHGATFTVEVPLSPEPAEARVPA